MKPFARVALVLLGAGIATVIIFFCLGNRQLVSVDLLNWETEPIPLWAVVVTAFAVGFCLPAIVLVAFAIKAAFRSLKQRRTIRALRRELNALRNLPLAEPERPDVGDELAEAVLAASGKERRSDQEKPKTEGDIGAAEAGTGAGSGAGSGMEGIRRAG